MNAIELEYSEISRIFFLNLYPTGVMEVTPVISWRPTSVNETELISSLSGSLVSIRWFSVCFACLLMASTAVGAELMEFRVPSGSAVETLPIAAQQGRIEILFASDMVNDVRTHRVEGKYVIADALARMLAGTPLEAVPAREGTAYGIVYRARRTGDARARGVEEMDTQSNLTKRTEMNFKKEETKSRLSSYE